MRKMSGGFWGNVSTILFLVGSVGVVRANETPKGNAAALFNAVARNDLPAVKRLLATHPKLVAARDIWDFTPLLNAAKDGHLELASLLLDYGADPNAIGEYRQTTLEMAVSTNNYELVKLLLDRGAKVNAKDRASWESLQGALIYNKNDQAILKLLMERGAKLEQRNAEGQTPLMAAANYSGAAALSALLMGGANATAKDDKGATALHALRYSSSADYRSELKQLLDHGAQIDAQDNDGDSTLLTAMKNPSHVDPDQIAALLDNGADPNLRNLDGDCAVSEALRAKVTPDVPHLWEKANMGQPDRYGMTPLQLALAGHAAVALPILSSRIGAEQPLSQPFLAAAQDDVPALAQFLQDHPAWRELRLADGSTLLHIAALWGSLNCADLLLRKGAVIDARNSRAQTPLHVCLHNEWFGWHKPDAIALANRNVPEMAALLVQDGADLNVQDDQGDTPLATVCKLDLTTQVPQTVHGDELARLLLDHGADVNLPDIKQLGPLEIAVDEHSYEYGITERLAGVLLDYGADVSHPDQFHRSPLSIAARSCDPKTLGRMLANGAALNEPDPDIESPLGNASYAGREESAIFLVEQGADINRYNAYGDSLLEQAIWMSKPKLAQLMIDKGIDLNGPHNVQFTPLTVSIQKQNRSMVELLLAKGADPNWAGRDGLTPLAFAMQLGSKEFAEILREHSGH